MTVPPSRAVDHVQYPELIELERLQARRAVDQAIARMFDIYRRDAGSRGRAIDAIEDAQQILHNDVRWFASSRIADATEATYPARRRHLALAADEPDEVQA